MTHAAALSNRIVLADLIPGARVRDPVLVLAGAGLTGLAAQFSIHTGLSPVPFTLQTLSVLVVGASLGPVRGVLSMLSYAVARVAGVPWFANHTHGIGGPSFGYIVGFVVAAAVVGALAKRGANRHVASTVALMALGTIVVYLIGASWLAHPGPGGRTSVQTWRAPVPSHGRDQDRSRRGGVPGHVAPRPTLTSGVMYVGVEHDTGLRHVSFVPWFEGLESLRGRLLSDTERGDALSVMQYATCLNCRDVVYRRGRNRPGNGSPPSAHRR